MQGQGLTGVGTSAGPGDRTVADRSYFEHELRRRTTELQKENEKLRAEVEAFEKDNYESFKLERNVEELQAKEKSLRTQLGSYNLVLEKLHVQRDMAPDTILDEANSWRAKNEAARQQVDTIFQERNIKENQLAEIEGKIEKLRSRAEGLITAMDPAQRQAYDKTRKEKNALVEANATYQAALQKLSDDQERLDKELRRDPSKQQSVELHNTVRDLTQKRDALRAEASSKMSVPEEIERLTQEVKATNAAISNLNHQTSSALDDINKVRFRIQQVEQSLKEGKSDRAMQFKTLIKKDKVMTEFLEKFKETRNAQLKELKKFEVQIMEALDALGELGQRGANVPDAGFAKQLNTDLEFKKTQMEHSSSTADKLTHELEYRKAELQKMNNLDKKIADESANLKEDMARMQKELEQLGDIETVKDQFYAQKGDLEAQTVAAERRGDTMAENNLFYEEKHEQLERELRGKDAHIEVETVQKSLRHYNQNVYSLEEFIQGKSADGDYKILAGETMEMVSQINSLLVESLK